MYQVKQHLCLQKSDMHMLMSLRTNMIRNCREIEEAVVPLTPCRRLSVTSDTEE